MWSLLFDPTQCVLLFRFSGVLTETEVAELDAAAISFVTQNGTAPCIVDMTDVTAVDLSTAFIRTKSLASPWLRTQSRVVVAPDPEIFGLFRLYVAHQELAGYRAPQIVRTFQAALQALELRTADFSPVASKKK